MRPRHPCPGVVDETVEPVVAELGVQSIRGGGDRVAVRHVEMDRTDAFAALGAKGRAVFHFANAGVDGEAATHEQQGARAADAARRARDEDRSLPRWAPVEVHQHGPKGSKACARGGGLMRRPASRRQFPPAGASGVGRSNGNGRAFIVVHE
jgi:hypothetical protein